MIVPSMNLEEIFKEVMDDHISILKLFTVKLQIQAAVMKRTHNYRWVETLRIKSKRNNEWRVAINFRPGVQEVAIYVKAYDKSGLVAYSVNVLGDQIPLLVKYTGHFLKRYNERMNLGLTKPEEVLKHFFKNNTNIIPSCSEEEMTDGGRLSFFSFPSGIGLGRFYPEQLTVHIRTFIAGQTLSKNQRDRVKMLQQEEMEGGFYKKGEFAEQAEHSLNDLMNADGNISVAH